MKYKNKIFCDFCFEEVADGSVCAKCGLTHETCTVPEGALMPGVNIQGKYIIGRVLEKTSSAIIYVAFSAEKDGPVLLKEYYPERMVSRSPGEEAVVPVSPDISSEFNDGAALFEWEAGEVVRKVFDVFRANGTLYYASDSYLDTLPDEFAGTNAEASAGKQDLNTPDNSDLQNNKSDTDSEKSFPLKPIIADSGNLPDGDVFKPEDNFTMPLYASPDILNSIKKNIASDEISSSRKRVNWLFWIMFAVGIIIIAVLAGVLFKLLYS